MRRSTRLVGWSTLDRAKPRLSGATVALVVLALSVGSVAAAVADEGVKPATRDGLARFDRSGTIAADGGAVTVSGPIRCPAGYTVRLRATVSERATGAVAEGFWSKNCTGASQHWNLTAKVTDGVSLKAGGACGGGLAIIRRHGKAVSTRQWIGELSLTAAGKAGAASRC